MCCIWITTWNSSRWVWLPEGLIGKANEIWDALGLLNRSIALTELWERLDVRGSLEANLGFQLLAFEDYATVNTQWV